MKKNWQKRIQVTRRLGFEVVGLEMIVLKFTGLMVVKSDNTYSNLFIC